MKFVIVLYWTRICNDKIIEKIGTRIISVNVRIFNSCIHSIVYQLLLQYYYLKF
jgi:hypothetical protein